MLGLPVAKDWYQSESAGGDCVRLKIGIRVSVSAGIACSVRQKIDIILSAHAEIVCGKRLVSE